MNNLPSLSEIWAAGYKTRRCAVGKDRNQKPVDFEVSSPNGDLVGYANSSTGVAKLVICHQRSNAA